MQQPKPHSVRYPALIADIDAGRIKIPKFQREFVWSVDATAKLLDSILKGYPIGTFILWQTRERMSSIRNIGDAQLPETPDGDAVQFVLDGQQRITSIYAALKGITVEREGKAHDYKDIFVNLDIDPTNLDESIVVSEKPLGMHLRLHDLLNMRASQIVGYTSNATIIDRIDRYKQAFETYDFSAITMSNESVDDAIEVFTRINTGGTELTLFEIMCAKTYDESQGFDLREQYDVLAGRIAEAGYDVPSSTVLQCLGVILDGECKRKTILKLDRDRIISAWEDMSEALKETVEYFRSTYRIPVSGILPYNALLVPFTYFFWKKKDVPSPIQAKYLQEFFWKASLSYHYSSAVETKLGQDIKRVDSILQDERPKYDYKPQLNREDLVSQSFSVGDSFCKAILCLFAYHQPLSFQNNASVRLDNAWLKVSFSKNYHHFFPKAFLRKQGIVDANVILNIAFVDDYLNKRTIKARAPSDYVRQFEQDNPHLREALKSHLILDPVAFGIWDDDFVKFLEERAKVVEEELHKRLEPIT